MASPSELQQMIHERQVSPAPAGLDALSYRLKGKWNRARWKTARIASSARRMDELRNHFSELSEGDLSLALKEMRLSRRMNPSSDCLDKGIAMLAVAAERELGLAAYQVQLMASSALAQGYLAEVDTGEGKTLALALTAAFQAWTGFPCHVITANDYLAERDAGQMKKFYQRAGLTVGFVVGASTEPDRREAYRCSVTYSTSKEVAADYLRDRLKLRGLEASRGRLNLAKVSGVNTNAVASMVQAGLYFALLDEADNALIDEAVTPLIISRPLEAGELEVACAAAWDASEKLVRGLDYELDTVRKMIEFLPGRMEEAVAAWDIPEARLWNSRGRRGELLRLAVEAKEFFVRDEHYVVEDEKVVIVDQSTGRRMPMRTWRQGLHQMIEAKEGVPLSPLTETIARISFQSFFRRYQNLAGASGTVSEVAGEIWQTYGIATLTIPRNLPSQKQLLGGQFYPDMESKYRAIGEEVRVRHAREQPVLVGARSVEASEEIEKVITGGGLRCQVLNARRHQEEAVLIRQAGGRSRITVATSMAGRGTDILLGHGVGDLGGLHVVASEPHESARVDRQFFGRSARQGDPGSVLTIYSAEDSLFGRFLPKWIVRVWQNWLRSRNRLIRWMGVQMGHLLVRWCQFRAQARAVKSRRQVMKSEIESRGNLGFSFGRPPR